MSELTDMADRINQELAAERPPIPGGLPIATAPRDPLEVYFVADASQVALVTWRDTGWIYAMNGPKYHIGFVPTRWSYRARDLMPRGVPVGDWHEQAWRISE